MRIDEFSKMPDASGLDVVERTRWLNFGFDHSPVNIKSIILSDLVGITDVLGRVYTGNRSITDVSGSTDTQQYNGGGLTVISIADAVGITDFMEAIQNIFVPQLAYMSICELQPVDRTAWTILWPLRVLTYVKQGSTAVFRVQIEDENGNPITPATMVWTLSDDEGNIINAREDVGIGPGAIVEVVLGDADTQPVVPFGTLRRVLTVRATYDSTLGTGLEIVGDYTFELVRTVAT